ncbi:MAG: PVC-type heme-binding CxxCH protein [Verrucomicrobiota bacterium]
MIEPRMHTNKHDWKKVKPEATPSNFVMRVYSCAFVVAILFSTTCLYGQNGDKKDTPGEVQIAPIPPEKIPPAPVLTPEQALKSFKLAPGFHIELVASEPLVHDPVAMTFAPDGKMWVVEMSGYMPNAEGKGEDAPVGKIAVLEDTDGDGKTDKRTVFLDGLVMPRALALVRDGLLVAEPPHLWFCRDTDGDGKSDQKTEVAKDYGDQKSPEHTANGLMWALDNWMYSADTTMRFRSGEEDWIREPTSFRGQFGISQDDFGRIVYNSNSDQFRIDLVPSKYLQRNPNCRTPAGLNVDPIKNQTVWPIRVTPGVNRGYRKGTLRADGTLEKFTAACGPLIYRGDNFPAEFRGNAFVCEPSANLIKRNILREENGVMTGRHAYTNSEFLASTDERFRPVNLNNGPDGALYVVDMYRGILQHRIFLTSYLRAQSEARGLEKPVGLGRIYRVVADGKSPKPVRLAKTTSAELVENLSQANGWVRDTAQRLLVERNEAKTIPLLQAKATSDKNFLGGIHALWTLDGIGQMDKTTLLNALASTQPKVRATAIRLSEPFFKGADAQEFLKRFVAMTSTDLDPDIQLQLAFTLGEIADWKAEQGMLTIVSNSAANIYIRNAILTGLYKRELETLEKLLPTWKEAKPGRVEFLSGLSECIFYERKTNRVNRVFELAAKSPGWQQAALLDGIISTAPITKGKSAPRPRPLIFPSEPIGFVALGKNSSEETAERLKKISALVTWPGQPGYVAPPKIVPLTAAQEKQFAFGRDLFAVSCAACHQLTGLGMEGLAPPLADSEWVLGSPEKLERILLHGVRGPISVKGKVWEMEMPALGVFDDEQIASVLTYIRREWEHGATPVEAAAVKKVRDATASRNEAWTEAELLKIP